MTDEELRDTFFAAEQAASIGGQWNDDAKLTGLRAVAARARAEALEEAATILDSVNNYDNPMTANDCAAAIRAHAAEGGER